MQRVLGANFDWARLAESACAEAVFVERRLVFGGVSHSWFDDA
jgi:hypothetical protein